MTLEVDDMITRARRSKRRMGLKVLPGGAKSIVLYGLAAFIVWFAIHATAITVDGLRDELHKTDVAVVLGNKVEVSGVPSPALKGRLERTVELYQSGYFDSIIVSGGVGKEGHDEAFVMKEFLVERGIPHDIIIIDSNGYNTALTAENTKQIMVEQGFESLMIISQFFHISRSKLAFKQQGLTEIYSAHAKDFFIRDIYSVFREFFAYYKYLIF